MPISSLHHALCCSDTDAIRGAEYVSFGCFFFPKRNLQRYCHLQSPWRVLPWWIIFHTGECLSDFHGVVTSRPTNFDAWRLLLCFAKVLLHTTSCKLTRVGNGSLAQGEHLPRRGGGRAEEGFICWTLCSTKWDTKNPPKKTFSLALRTIAEKTLGTMFVP